MKVTLTLDGVQYQGILKQKEKVCEEVNDELKEKIYEESYEERLTKLRIVRYLNKWGNNRNKLIHFLLCTNSFNNDMIADHMDCPRSESIEVISKLSQGSFVTRRGKYYVKSKFGESVLKQEHYKNLTNI